MSDAATMTLPVSHELPHPAHATLPAELSIPIRAARLKNGLAFAAGGASIIGVGGFLLSQISSTPALASQIAILGSVGIVGGLAMLTRSVRDLLGRFVIDDNGIKVSPLFAGFSISWSELTRWEVTEEFGQHPEAPGVLFWTEGSPCPQYIPNNWLSSAAREEIRTALWSRASGKKAD